MLPDPSNPILVAAGLVFRRGRLLITQRRAQDHLGGLWEFPGGKVEPGETFEQGLHRELMEELGISVRVESLLEEVTHAYAEKTVRIRFYRCVWTQHEPQPMGCHALAWVTADELADYSFPPADAHLLATLTARSELWGPTDSTRIDAPDPE
jgi:mutator protein MutT